MGDKKIGVSLSDPTLSIAQGLKLYRRSSLAEDLEEFKRIVKEHGVDEIVVGLPRDLSGKIGTRAQSVMELADKIREATDIPVNLWDERFSTNEAHRVFDIADVCHKKRKPFLDIMASQIILQGYLDARRTR
ncbi:MAG: Holliday junction resolvase RuvX [Syntrophorhabdaceae bacterium]